MTYRRLTAGLAAAALLTGLTAPSAEAATPERRGMHRGTDGCFNWSWDDGGWSSTTVYWHNTCDRAEKLAIAWKWTGLEVSRITVPADGKGHQARRSEPESIWDDGAA
ncbi:hypothetical protein ACIOJE_35175 [Kitasatospora sp. NPDC087861]|uniref:hypothetical protein n=1 Tax=Kitasatospora sp. NPDC087861 TaxID=3364070 RepID=UPI003827340A